MNDEAKNHLWRYISFAKFFDMVTRRRLFFSRLAFLEDEYEGRILNTSESKRDMAMFLKQIRGMQGAPDSEDPVSLVDRMEEIQGTDIKERIYVNCWHENLVESAVMWKSYCSTIESLCIKANPALIRQSLPSFVFYSQIDYVDLDDPQLPHSHTRFLRKQREFRDEREVRLFARFHPQRTHPDAEVAAAGMYVSILDFQFVEEIIVYPTATRWFEAMVRNIAAENSFPCPIVRSRIRLR